VGLEWQTQNATGGGMALGVNELSVVLVSKTGQQTAADVSAEADGCAR
jgi:hypothetical protein